MPKSSTSIVLCEPGANEGVACASTAVDTPAEKLPPATDRLVLLTTTVPPLPGVRRSVSRRWATFRSVESWRSARLFPTNAAQIAPATWAVFASPVFRDSFSPLALVVGFP